MASSSVPNEDPLIWLEELRSKRVMDWVEPKNAASLAKVEGFAEYPKILGDAKALIYAKDRVPFAAYSEGYLYNFWTDAKNERGLFRRTTLEEYRKAQPSWEVLLDFDALAQSEGKKWVNKGMSRLERKSPRRLVSLSQGGKDAVEVREYDLSAKRFVLPSEGGFFVAEAKTDVTPYDFNTLFVGSDFGPGSLTDSGYPRIVKKWKRGQNLDQALTVLEGQKTDISVSAEVIEDHQVKHVLLTRSIGFFDWLRFYLTDQGTLVELPIPTSSQVLGIKKNFVYVQLKDEWTYRGVKRPGQTLIRFSVNDLLKVTADFKSRLTLDDVEVVYVCEDRVAITGVELSDDRVLLTVLKNVHNEVYDIKQSGSGFWKAEKLPIQDSGTIQFGYRDELDLGSYSTLYFEDHLTPKTQYRVHGLDGDGPFKLEPLKSSPSRFDSSQFEVHQYFATSKDGTQIPYTILHRKGMALDGSNPTVLYGYGGFEVSLDPYYSGLIGKLWLERGGVYVVANIRGGGEFGPKWHQDAVLHNRQRCYDDFIAVAEDLIGKKITSPKHLGIQGGSNGGLLTGAVMVQRPDLFQAVLIQSPLLDMVRYTELPPGASWMAEYGDPKKPEDLAYILKYSPYQNVKKDAHYPEPFFTTSTADDRVHPAHARKMARKMEDLGHSVYFFENTQGGHSGSSTLEELAHLVALEYSYLWMKLSVPGL